MCYFYYREELEMFYFSSEARKILVREFLEVNKVTFYQLIRNFCFFIFTLKNIRQGKKVISVKKSNFPVKKVLFLPACNGPPFEGGEKSNTFFLPAKPQFAVNKVLIKKILPNLRFFVMTFALFIQVTSREVIISDFHQTFGTFLINILLVYEYEII